MNTRLIMQMSKIIVDTVHPNRIILFGSQAKDTASANSDYDFMIVSDTLQAHTRYQMMAQLWRALSPFKVPKDILIYNTAEIERWRHSKNHIIARAMREGKVVYERP